MEKELITAMLFKTDGSREVITLENELHIFQKCVGGYIETVPFGNNLIIVCDEEGVIKGKERNNSFDYICGDFLIVRARGDHFISLKISDISFLNKFFDGELEDWKMKKIITAVDDGRLCRDCKHRIKNPECVYGKCELYKPSFRGDELLVSKYDKVKPFDCPLISCKYSDRGKFYIKKRIPLWLKD